MTAPPAHSSLWWQRGTVYQVYPRSFRDTNGDGIGDLPGVTSKLDYLCDTLGIDAIWLSPFFPSPMADFGYDVADYTGVDPMFGTLADLDELILQAHRRGLQIIIDFVPNHTSDQHPWFVESRASRDNPKRDWYLWRDAKPDGSPPNNWLSMFGGRAWEWDAGTEQFYLHSFLKEQPDLNWRNPQVRAAMLDVLRFWLDRGVDGFRIDVAHMILKDPELRDNPPREAPGEVLREYDTQEHLYDRTHADVHGAFRGIRQLLDEYSSDRPRFAVGEIHEYNWHTWASYYGSQLDELHMPFNFALLRAPWSAAAMRAVVDNVEAALPPGAWPNYVLGNHDEHRVASRIGAGRARLAMMLLLTLRGTPTLYYGDEIGMHDVDIPPDRIQDPFEINVPGLALGRDPERTPMQWDDSPNAGFCPPVAESWLPIADDYRTVNVGRELTEHSSMLSLTRRLLNFRRAQPALQLGSYRPLDGLPADIYAYLREQGPQRILVVLNFGSEPRTLELEGYGRGETLVSTGLNREQMLDLRALPVSGDEGMVIKLDGVTPP